MSCTIVTGPPSAGKTTYVANHAGENDIVYDLDAIAAALNPRFESYLDRPQDVANLILGWRDELCARLMNGQMDRHVWIIIANPYHAQQIACPLHAEVVVCKGPHPVCDPR